MSKHIPRIYSESALARNTRLRLDEATAHHLVHVLRLKQAAAVVLFDGHGGEYRGRIAAHGKDWVEVDVAEHQPVRRESSLHITLGQAVSRGERMDYTLQKAIELGVQAIQPLDSERSQPRLEPVRQNKKQRHWQEVVRSAAEQCGREQLPLVPPTASLGSWLASLPDDACKLVLDPQAQSGLSSLPAATRILLLSGPEGGFSDDELALATASGFRGIRLGPRILRTETAAVACLAAIQVLWGDLGN